MAKKEATKKTTEKATTNDINAVQLIGTVLRPKEFERFTRFTLVCESVTTNGNIAKSYIPVVWFNAGSEDTVVEDERISVNGYIKSGKYEKDGHTVYTLDVIAQEVIFND